MTVRYIEPLSRGISRARKALFGPVDLRKWFVIGFTAFLAGLTNFGIPGPPNLGLLRRSSGKVEDALYFPQRAWEWVGAHPGWALAILLAVVLGFVAGIIFTWVSSRGKFMFLDNVVRDRSEVVKPWHEYKKEGNSFFVLSLFWGLAALAICLAYISYCIVNLQQLFRSSGNGRELVLPAILAGLGFFLIVIFAAFISVMLRDFVVPIMYRDRTTAWKAVQKFLPLFFSGFPYFVGYGLFLLCLGLLIIIGIIIAGCVTFCIGFLILAIPYINAVILLPISYALRAFSVEFLEQFGRGFDIFPRPDVNPPEETPLMG